MEPNGYGIVVNNTIYATMRDSRIVRLYKELEGKMTTQEKRSFVITYAENEKRNDTKIFKLRALCNQTLSSAVEESLATRQTDLFYLHALSAVSLSSLGT